MDVKTILVVDDEPYQRKVLADILETRGYRPTAVGRGEAALEWLTVHTPVVALIDLRLDDMSGLEVLAAIKERTAQTECIMLTGHASKSSAIAAVNLGAYSYVEKPYDVEQLLMTIRRAVEKCRTEQRLDKSRRYLQALFDNTLDAILILDDEGRYVDANPAACALLGYTRQELLGLTLADITPASEQEISGDRWGKFLATGKQAGEYTLLCKDGTRIEAEYRAVANFVQRRHMSVLRDITQRKRAEQERKRLMAHIQEQARQMQLILDTVPEGVLLLNGEGRIILANPVAKKQLTTLADVGAGKPLSHLGGRPLAELLNSPPRGTWHEVTSGPPDERTFEVIARPFRLDADAGRWVMVVRDVTEEREIQERVQRQERLAAVGQLAAGIAHDFNNIMAVIVLYTEIALSTSPNLSLKGRDRLKTVIQQAKQASDLIQQILDFSRRAVIKRRPLNLAPLIKEQVRLLKRTLPENIEINFADQQPECVANVDPTRIQQMVMNMALNARDAMPEGGKLHLRLEQMQIQSKGDAPLPEMALGMWVQLEMTDTGVGIPPDALSHIFDPFYTTKPPGQGSGLGLAQVYGIVKQHGGEIDVHSQVGQGTRFTVYLPALPVGQQEQVSAEMTDPARGAGQTVLVVEDDPITRKALVDTLATLNYRAWGVANGRQALETFGRRGEEIALVLSDVVMPEMGGVALLQALRKKSPTLPVVLMTGHPMEREMDDLRGKGLTAWLPKPPDLERLAQVVARAMESTGGTS